ncbi:MAG: hypothetical protein ABI678_00150 [Kofleriaceae bacterium]
MVAWESLFVVFLLAGCSERNKEVCCLTAADCESLGLSANDVGSRGCRDGEACVDLACVSTSAVDDAAVDGPQMDSGSTGRCDPMKDFDAATRIPNIGAARRLVLTRNELTAYVVRQTTNNFVVTSATRAATTEDFPVDADDPKIAPASHSDEVWASGDEGLLLYHRKMGTVNVCERSTPNEVYPAGRQVLVGPTQDPLSSSQLVAVNGDASELYFTQSDMFLYEADGSGINYSFESGVKIAPMLVGSATMTADELSLLYTPPGAGAGILISTRASTHAMFPQGVALPGFQNDDVPFFITADRCELYVGGARSGVDGVFVARRPH